MEMTQLAPNLFVSGQIAENDLADLAGAGFTDVVCNRPDAEHPESAPSASMAEAAKALGLAFHYLPIAPGAPFADEAEAVSQIVAGPGAKVLAYCRSGARSSNVWTLAQALQASGPP